MGKDDVLVDELPDPASLVANWENRISLLEHEVGMLPGQGAQEQDTADVLALLLRIPDRNPDHRWRRGDFR